MVLEKTPLLMGMTLCWRSVLPQDVYFHKNRTERLQRGLNCLKPYKPASGGINVMLELKKNGTGGGRTF